MPAPCSLSPEGRRRSPLHQLTCRPHFRGRGPGQDRAEKPFLALEAPFREHPATISICPVKLTCPSHQRPPYAGSPSLNRFLAPMLDAPALQLGRLSERPVLEPTLAVRWPYWLRRGPEQHPAAAAGWLPPACLRLGWPQDTFALGRARGAGFIPVANLGIVSKA